MIRNRVKQFYKRCCSLLSVKTITWLAIIIFILLLIPILNLADVNRATGDDYGYAIRTRHAWLATNSLWGVLKAAGETVYYTYYSWQGTWFDVFLFSLQPEIFHRDAYVVVPYLMLILWIGSTFLLFRHILIHKLGVDKWAYRLFTLVFLIAAIEFIPSTKSSIFWYNGAAHYMIPFAMCQILLVCLLKYTECYRKRYLTGIIFFMTLLGGTNYQAALFGLITAVYIGKYDFIKKRNVKIFLLFIPIILETIGLLVSMRAPGNKNRGGEEFGLSIGKGLDTIIQSFVQGIMTIGDYIVEKPLVIVSFLFLFLLSVEMFLRIEKKQSIKYGMWIILALICLYCAMYAPAIYAGVEVSRGVLNMNFQVFMLMVSGIIIILANKFAEKIDLSESKIHGYLLIPGMFVCMLLIFGMRSSFKSSSSWVCYEYSQIGRDEIYEEQMDYWMSLLLNDEVKDVVLPSINDDQGPLMFMPVIDNPDAWTNTVTKNYFQKDSLIAIPRDEWIEKYGEPVLGEIPY